MKLYKKKINLKMPSFVKVKEQVLMWNRKRQLFLLEIFIDWDSTKS